MGFLKGIFGGNGVITISAPCAGRLKALRDVKDPTFSAEILGQGVAIVPFDGKFYAPADGIVATVFPTGHAAAMKTAGDADVLLHIGLDTVKLNGKYFTIYVEEGQRVKKGDPLLEPDLEAIRKAGYDLTTPVVICNSDAFDKITTSGTEEVAVGDEILRLTR